MEAKIVNLKFGTQKMVHAPLCAMSDDRITLCGITGKGYNKRAFITNWPVTCPKCLKISNP